MRIDLPLDMLGEVAYRALADWAGEDPSDWATSDEDKKALGVALGVVALRIVEAYDGWLTAEANAKADAVAAAPTFRESLARARVESDACYCGACYPEPHNFGPHSTDTAPLGGWT